MCTLFEEIANEGRTEGCAEEIIDIGHEMGLSDTDILAIIQNQPMVKKNI